MLHHFHVGQEFGGAQSAWVGLGQAFLAGARQVKPLGRHTCSPSSRAPFRSGGWVQRERRGREDAGGDGDELSLGRGGSRTS